MVRAMALGVARTLPPSATVSAEDLEAVGRVALVEAAGRFDGSRGVPFGGYAKARVRGAMLDELRRHDTVSRERRQRIREGSDDESAMPVPRLVSEEAAAGEAVAGLAPDEHIDRLRQLAAVRGAVERLPPRMREIYRLRVVEGKTLAQIGETEGVTEARICQLVAEIVERLREDVDVDDVAEDAGTFVPRGTVAF